MTLTLERKDERDSGRISDMVSMTPRIDEDYWAYRVVLSEKQAIVGFPKFGTIGIGFAVEDDWNTNLPYSSATETIFEHIRHNKGDDSISDDDVRAAIEMVRQAVKDDLAASDETVAKIETLDLPQAREALVWLYRNGSSDVRQAAFWAGGEAR